MTSVSCYYRREIVLYGFSRCGSLLRVTQLKSPPEILYFELILWFQTVEGATRTRHEPVSFVLRRFFFFFSVSRCQTQVIRSQHVPQNILKRLESPLDAEETTCEPQSISVLHTSVAPNMASEVLNDLLCLYGLVYDLPDDSVIYFLAFSKRGVTYTPSIWEKIEQWLQMTAGSVFHAQAQCHLIPPDSYHYSHFYLIFCLSIAAPAPVIFLVFCSTFHCILHFNIFEKGILGELRENEAGRKGEGINENAKHLCPYRPQGKDRTLFLQTD